MQFITDRLGIDACRELQEMSEGLAGEANYRENLPDIRERVKANVQANFMGASIRNFKLYDYVALPDGTGNVSWLVVPAAQAGAATLHATGPVTFCKMIEMFAESQGLTFGASGVKRGDDKLVTPDEQSVFSAIGAGFVSLDLRESIRYIDPVGS